MSAELPLRRKQWKHFLGLTLEIRGPEANTCGFAVAQNPFPLLLTTPPSLCPSQSCDSSRIRPPPQEHSM